MAEGPNGFPGGPSNSTPSAKKGSLANEQRLVALGDAVKDIQAVAAEVGLPPSIATSFEGSAQVFQQAVANQGMLLFAAVLVKN